MDENISENEDDDSIDLQKLGRIEIDEQHIGEDEIVLNVEADVHEDSAEGSSLSDTKVALECVHASSIDHFSVVPTILTKGALEEKYKLSWDPFNSSEWDSETVSSFCIQRVKNDLTALFSEAHPLIYLEPEEDDITKLHTVISGPEGTPYEGGFFYFFLRAPPQYPFEPLKVKLMTTGHERVRFNPNFYKNGKVCLSILGTWSGPAWTASQSILSVVLSIQSLMNENPYFNEPGFSKEVFPGASKLYNQCIVHETVRVAVCDFMETQLYQLPETMQGTLEKSFLAYRDHYRDLTKQYQHLDGEPLKDPFQWNFGCFQFAKLQERIDAISERFLENHPE